MSLRNTLRKAAGLLVELPPEETENNAPHASGSAHSSTDQVWAELEKAAQGPQAPGMLATTKTVEQIVREGHGPNLDQIKIAPEALAAVSHPENAVNFAGIYQAANLPVVPFTAEQVLDMFAALPPDVPLENRRQMMKVSVNAMGKAIGTTPETIVADASRKLAALAAYSEHLTHTTAEYASLAEQKIAGLQAEIEKTRQAVAAAQHRQAHETQLCIAESDRLDDVLEFFSLDVPPSKYSPMGPSST